jgi:hypothetical protein
VGTPQKGVEVIKNRSGGPGRDTPTIVLLDLKVG